MKTITVASVVLIAAVAAIACWVMWPRLNRLIVINESGQLIRFLTVTVGGETIRFENIPMSGQSSAPFRIRSDDHYAVRGELADGTPIASDRGYVTNGMDNVTATFVIQRDAKVEFSEVWGGLLF